MNSACTVKRKALKVGRTFKIFCKQLMCHLTGMDRTLVEKEPRLSLAFGGYFYPDLNTEGMLEYKTDELSGSGWFCDRLKSKDRQRAVKESRESGCKRQFGRQLP